MACSIRHGHHWYVIVMLRGKGIRVMLVYAPRPATMAGVMIITHLDVFVAGVTQMTNGGVTVLTCGNPIQVQ
jgi:hypothetical protein